MIGMWVKKRYTLNKVNQLIKQAINYNALTNKDFPNRNVNLKMKRFRDYHLDTK